jgi:hypothetical protein
MKKIVISLAFITLGISSITSQTNKNTALCNKNKSNFKVVQQPIIAINSIDNLVANNKSSIPMSRIAAFNSQLKRFSLLQNKHITTVNSVVNFKSSTPLLKMKASKDTTFYEGFESFDGKTLNWIPANWTQLNLAPNTAYVAGDSINPTWSVNPSNDYADPSNGKSMAWVDKDKNSKPQDVWLVSPAFTPATEDYINFDFFYNPCMMYVDYTNSTDSTNVFDFKKANATMQLYISIDNGTKWTLLWDAIDDASQFDNANIESWLYTFGTWNTIQKSLATYAGQSAKIAFRYVGKRGGSMGLDEICVRQLQPAALYKRPHGYFILGLTTDYRKNKASVLLGPAYEKAVWENYSNLDSKSFLWTFADPKIANTSANSTEKNLEVLYKPLGTTVPTLKATGGAKDSTYSWGKAGSSYFVTGDSSNPVGAGNYDLLQGYSDFEETKSPGSYFFGTRADSTIDAIANYFEKPVHRYILDSLWVNVGEFAAPATTEFKLIIHRVNSKGFITDTIATAVCKAADLMVVDNGYNTMIFKGFTSVDSTNGLEVVNDYLEISDAILVELTGFNKKGITFAPFAQLNESPTGESNAYVYYNAKDSVGKITRRLVGSPDYIGARTSFFFNIAASYSYLQPDDSIFVAPISGGSKTFKVDALYSPQGWWLDTELPSWLSSDSTFNATTGEVTYTLKAAALPSEVKSRSAIVKVLTFGADMSINVYQGDYTGLTSLNTSNTKVISKGASYELTYSADFNSVSIYNLTGQLSNKFRLSPSGKTTIPASNFPTGVVLFKFSGKNSETVKVVR